MIIIASGEPYQAQAYIREIRSKKIKEGYEPYSFDAGENPETGNELLQLLRSQGLFQKKKMITVRGADGELVKTITKKYGKEKEEGDIILFLTQRKLSSSAGKDFLINHFNVPEGHALRRFIEEECKKRNAKPSYQIVNALFAAFSSKESSLFSLVNEIEKMSLAPHHALDVLTLPFDKNPFGITDAFARRNKTQMLFLLERELRNGVAPFDIVSRILWQIRVLILVAGSNSSSAYKLSLHPFVIKKASQALSLFSLSELVAYYRQATSLYGQILFSGLPSELLLSRFFWKI